MVRLTMNIISDCLADYKARYRPGLRKDIWINQVRLFSPSLEEAVSHTLYVCADKYLRRSKLKNAEQAAFICVGGDGMTAERPVFRSANFFLIAGDMPCLAGLMNHLLEQQERLDDWERQLDEAILLRKDFQTIMELCTSVFQNNLSLLWDPAYNILAHSNADPSNERLRQIVDQGFFSKEMTDDLAQMGYMKNALTFAKPTFMDTPNYMDCPVILRTFVVAQRVQYALCLYFSATNPSAGICDLFQIFPIVWPPIFFIWWMLLTRKGAAEAHVVLWI